MTEQSVLVQVDGLTKYYGEFRALEKLDIALGPGEVLGLVGPNGAGKSTTLRSLCGVIPPTQGRVEICGHDLEADPISAKAAMAFIPDDPNLFDALTVWEHLRFIASAYDVADFETPGAALIERFDLTAKRDTAAQELSRGMRQKVSVCCAYLHNPRVILFDEPLTGLDPKAIRTLKQSIAERAAAGAAVVVSSHLLQLIEDLCTSLLILHEGRVRYSGSIAGVRDFFDGLSADASLEEVFFRATEGGDAAAERVSGGEEA